MEHYYSEIQTSQLNLRVIQARMRQVLVRLYAGSGVFSPDRVDRGTLLLVENSIVHARDRVLDLGCGYGAVGIVIAKAFSQCSVVMADVNKRAVKLARMNVKENKVENAAVVHSDCYKSIKGMFDTIIINPPQKAGKKLCFSMIEGAKERLSKKGTLQIVARHQKGGKELSKKMMAVFGNVRDIAKKGGYRVYLSERGG